MNRSSRFAVGAFSAAALYYIFGRVLRPGDRSFITAIPPAVLFGLILETLQTRRTRLTKPDGDPYPPRFYFLAGLSGLGACVAFWIGGTSPLSWAAWFGLLAGVAWSVCLLACGVTMARHGRSTSAPFRT